MDFLLLSLCRQYHSKGFLVNLEKTLCKSAYAPPHTVVSWCTKRHTGLMAKRIPLVKVFLYKASIHVFLALPCWVAREGRRNQVGSKAGRGAEVVQEQGGQRWDTWCRCGLPGRASSSAPGASLQTLSSSAPSSRSLQQRGAPESQLSCHMPHS